MKIRNSVLGFCSVVAIPVLFGYEVLLAEQAPVKVYIMAGQSNMQGKGSIEGEGSNSLRYTVKNDSKTGSK